MDLHHAHHDEKMTSTLASHHPIRNDLGRDENQQFCFCARASAGFKQITQHGHIAKKRHLAHLVAFDLLENPTQYNGAAVLD